jgi:DNA-directed RNA polymerase
MEAIKGCSMPQVYEALNYLGKVTWTINKDVYTVLKVPHSPLTAPQTHSPLSGRS